MADRSVVIPKGMEVQYEGWKLAPGLRVGNTLYCSGQLGMGPDGTLPKSAEEQFVNAFEAVKVVLEEAGASFANVVEISSFHVGLIDELETFGTVRDRYIQEPYPAQTAIGVTELGMPGAFVELKVIAVL
jgi:enamine deaminase RidA (YjgF/YER057c/UK114 family)